MRLVEVVSCRTVEHDAGAVVAAGTDRAVTSPANSWNTLAVKNGCQAKPP